MNRFPFLFLVSWLPCASAAAADLPMPADHAAQMAASQALFKDTVRDFLMKNCFDCHGGEKTKSGFNMGTRETLLEGGEHGVTVVPGKANESRLVKLIAREEEPHMPPKNPVAKEAVAAVAKWIDLGAAYDKPLVGSA